SPSAKTVCPRGKSTGCSCLVSAATAPGSTPWKIPALARISSTLPLLSSRVIYHMQEPTTRWLANQSSGRCVLFDSSTLHRIRMSSLSKLRIRHRVDESGISPRGSHHRLGRLPDPHPTPPQAVQGLRHAVTRERPHVAGLRLCQKFGDVGGPHAAAVQRAFEALEPEGRQHQQPRDQRDEEP